MKTTAKFLLICCLIGIKTNAYSQCAIGEGGVTNFTGNTQEVVAFIQQTAKNIESSVDYLPYDESQFYSQPENRKRVFDFDNLLSEGIIAPSGGGYLFHVGKFWASHLPQSTGVVMQCDPECGLSPII